MPWEKPFMTYGRASQADGMLPYNAISRKNYRGINIALLWGASTVYGSNSWVTYKQAGDLGGNVKKGEKSTPILFFKMAKKTDKVTGEEIKIPCPRIYHVFNTEQCENLKPRELKPVIPPADPKGAVLEIARQLNVNLSHGGNRACFIPSADLIQMPHFDQFKTEEYYSATLAHELTHWTGHKPRLARDLSGMFGCEKYAKEELIAEMGSAFLCAELGIQYDARHAAAYLQNWLTAAKEDKKFLFSSASAASKAVDYLMQRHASPVTTEDGETEEEPRTEEQKATDLAAIQSIKAAL